MSEPIGTPETSMEAILASIRRIIAEDGIQPPPGARPAPLSRPEPSPQPNPPAAEPNPPAAELGPAPSSPPPRVTAAQPALSSPPVFTMSLITPAPAAAPAFAAEPISPVSAPESVPEPVAPNAVRGVLRDRAGTGEELVLTQMVADDGSVVAQAKRGSPSAVLLLTDALPAGMPDVAVPVTPPQKSEPSARPAPKPVGDAGRLRVGLAGPETPVTSAAVLEQLSRARSQARAASPNPPASPMATANLEELVRQSLEPKIQEWLNANLLEIVERLVQQEIDRISRRT